MYQGNRYVNRPKLARVSPTSNFGYEGSLTRCLSPDPRLYTFLATLASKKADTRSQLSRCIFSPSRGATSSPFFRRRSGSITWAGGKEGGGGGGEGQATSVVIDATHAWLNRC
jgi:hypothetical protein